MRLLAWATVALAAVALAGCGSKDESTTATRAATIPVATTPGEQARTRPSAVTTADGVAVPANVATAFSQGRMLGEQLAAMGVYDEAAFVQMLDVWTRATMRAGYLVLPHNYLPLGYEIKILFDPADPAQVQAFGMGALDAAGAYFHQQAAQTPHPEVVTQEQPGERSEAAFRAHYQGVPAGYMMYESPPWSGTYGAPEYMKWYNENLALWRQGLEVDYPGPDVDAILSMSPPRRQSVAQQRRQLLAQGLGSARPADMSAPRAPDVARPSDDGGRSGGVGAGGSSASPPTETTLDAAFVTPSRNIACGYRGDGQSVGEVWCYVRSSRTLAVVNESGAGRYAEVRSGVQQPPQLASLDGPVLAYGAKWASPFYGTVKCVSQMARLTCVNLNGNVNGRYDTGFVASREETKTLSGDGTRPRG